MGKGAAYKQYLIDQAAVRVEEYSLAGVHHRYALSSQHEVPAVNLYVGNPVLGIQHDGEVSAEFLVGEAHTLQYVHILFGVKAVQSAKFSSIHLLNYQVCKLNVFGAEFKRWPCQRRFFEQTSIQA